MLFLSIPALTRPTHAIATCVREQDSRSGARECPPTPAPPLSTGVRSARVTCALGNTERQPRDHGENAHTPLRRTKAQVVVELVAVVHRFERLLIQVATSRPAAAPSSARTIPSMAAA